MSDEMRSQRVRIVGAGGDEIEAYTARPVGSGSRGGVLLFHHMPGWDRATKELTRRFAELGYDAILPNLHYRDAPGADPDDAAAASRANGGVPDERLLGDAAGALEWLRALDTSNGKVGCIGYCSGGRQSVLAATALPIDAAIDCYGGNVVRPAPSDFPIRIAAIDDRIADLRCPLLGLFGAEDKNPSPDDVARLEELLRASGKDYEFHTYEGAGHGFFASNRPAYRVEAANSGWERIAAFYARTLG